MFFLFVNLFKVWSTLKWFIFALSVISGVRYKIVENSKHVNVKVNPRVLYSDTQSDSCSFKKQIKTMCFVLFILINKVTQSNSQ